MKSAAHQHSPKRRHDHAQCLSSALAEAEKLCRRRGVNLTPARRRVLELVWQGHEPVKAYQIIDTFSTKKQTTRPPTVYRALDFLIANGLVHRIESQNAFVGCAHPVSQHDASFFICHDCQKVAEIDSRRLNTSLEKLARRNAFRIDHKTIEIYGLCSACAARQAKDAR